MVTVSFSLCIAWAMSLMVSVLVVIVGVMTVVVCSSREEGGVYSVRNCV